MFLTWEEAKVKYPNQWVIFKNPQFGDKFHMELIGGELFGLADDQEEMCNLLPDVDDGCIYAPRHTREDEAVGVLISGY